MAITRMLGPIPIVVTEHSRRQWNSHPFIGRMVRLILRRHGASFISCYKKNGVPLIRNPLHVSETPKERVSAASRLLVVGRLSASKRVNRILDAVNNSARDMPILVIGDGPLKRQLKKQASQLGLNVEFAGFQPEPWRLAKAGDLVVSASAYEGEPLSVVEALANGLPVLLSDIDAHRELVNDSTFMLFSSVRELARKIADARIMNGLEEFYLSSSSVSSLIHERDPQFIADQWVSIYSRVLARA